MKYKLLLLIVISFIFPSLLSQELRVKEMSVLTNDLTARTKSQFDGNGNACALVKVQLARQGAEFEGNVIGTPSYNVSEYLVYMAQGSKKVKIKTSGFLPLEVSFQDYGIAKLEEKTTYKLVVSIPSNVQVEEERIQTGWLVLDSKPTGARVYLNNDYVGDTPFQKKYAYGNYSYKLESPKYYDYVNSVDINQDKVELSIQLAPAFGSINVKSNVSGAEILLDGEKTGKTTPYTLTKVLYGQHQITLNKPMYAPYNTQVEVEVGKIAEVKADLSARYANIIIKTIDGADIYVDGIKKGTGIYKSDMMEAYYDIEVRKEHYKAVTKQIQVVAKQDQEIILDPTPIYGSLDVECTPLDATVAIDGKNYGTTPLSIKKLLEGEYDIHISKKGYSPTTEHVSISEGKTSFVSVTLDTLSSDKQVNISTDLNSDVIYIDNVKVGSSPYIGRLPIGQHLVYAMRNVMKSEVALLEITDSNEEVINLKLDFNDISKYNDYQDRTNKNRNISSEPQSRSNLYLSAGFNKNANTIDERTSLVLGYNYENFVSRFFSYSLGVEFQYITCCEEYDYVGMLDFPLVFNYVIPLSKSNRNSFNIGLGPVLGFAWDASDDTSKEDSKTWFSAGGRFSLRLIFNHIILGADIDYTTPNVSDIDLTFGAKATIGWRF